MLRRIAVSSTAATTWRPKEGQREEKKRGESTSSLCCLLLELQAFSGEVREKCIEFSSSRGRHDGL